MQKQKEDILQNKIYEIDLKINEILNVVNNILVQISKPTKNSQHCYPRKKIKTIQKELIVLNNQNVQNKMLVQENIQIETQVSDQQIDQINEQLPQSEVTDEVARKKLQTLQKRNESAVARQQFKYFSFEQINKMFQYFESKISKKPNGIKSLRNLLMWKVAFYSALRVGELVQIKMSDIQEYEGQYYLQVIRSKKGETTRNVFDKSTTEIYLKYLQFKVKSDYLFPSEDNPDDHLSERTVDHICKRNISKMNLNQNSFNFHKMRHSACSYYVNNIRIGLQMAKQILGHKSIKNTEIYCQTEIDQNMLNLLMEINKEIVSLKDNKKVTQEEYYTLKSMLEKHEFGDMRKQISKFNKRKAINFV